VERKKYSSNPSTAWHYEKCGHHHAPAYLPPGKTQCPLPRRLVGTWGQSEQHRKTCPYQDLTPKLPSL